MPRQRGGIHVVDRACSFGEEASDNARVWKLYRDRVSGRDDDQIESWNKTIDILLIFVSYTAVLASLLVLLM